MPKFTGSLALLHLDEATLLAALDEKLRKILIEGTVEWVRTVAAIIPNWSGQSRASLKPIADLVDVPIFVTTVPEAPNRQKEGEALGFGALIHEQGIYAFEWRSNVFYLAYNEANDANLVGFHLHNPGPYESQRQAQQSFFRTINPKLRALDFNISSHVRVIRRIIR
jgi:hypothetical protein